MFFWDCPAGIEQGFENAVAGADRAVVVTTPEVSAIRDADRIIGLLESKQIRNLELVINRIRIDMVKRGDMMSVEDVTEILPIHLLGAIPDDEQVVIATNQGEPVVGDDSPSGRAYMNICRRLCGEEVPLMDMNTKGRAVLTGSAIFSKRTNQEAEMGLFEGMDKKASVGIAKDRLRTVLVSDRIDCNPNVCELFQKDLFLTVSKYIDTTPETFDVSVTRSRITITLTGERL